MLSFKVVLLLSICVVLSYQIEMKIWDKLKWDERMKTFKM